MHNRKIGPGAPARDAAAAVPAWRRRWRRWPSSWWAAVSGCSIDFFKPESYAFIKDAIAATPVPEESPAIVGTPLVQTDTVDVGGIICTGATVATIATYTSTTAAPGAVNPSREARIVPGVRRTRRLLAPYLRNEEGRAANAAACCGADR